MNRVLITGGAGFIGSNLTRALCAKGYEVTVLDTLSPQVHGETPDESPLVKAVEGIARLVKGSVMDAELMERELVRADIVVHFAAETGTGQSMYNVNHYSKVNIGGTALMLDILGRTSHSIRRVVVASSRSIYGEGRYRDGTGNYVYPRQRESQDCEAGRFELYDPATGKAFLLCSTDEDSRIHPSSVYGITKQVQEQLVMTVCPALGIQPVALRYQNVYGPGQSLSNPYTGILSIFANLILQGKEINVFEDGLESRDFVYIDDTVASTLLAIEHEDAGGNVFNVGSGEAISVLEVVDNLRKNLGTGGGFRVSGEFRIGDIRHNYADIRRIETVLGYKAEVPFVEGVARFATWVKTQGSTSSAYEQSLSEMRERGLIMRASSSAS